MTHIPDEAVQAFIERYEIGCNHQYDENSIRAALIAALSYLQPVDVTAVRRQAFEEGFENGVEQSLNALDAYDDITRSEAEQGIRKLKPDYRALSAEPAQGGQWSEDMGAAPSDTIVLLAWWNTIISKWEYEAGLYHSTKGGWWHGSATHWMPLPSAPTTEAGR